MDEKDLKEKCLELFSRPVEVHAAICLVDHGTEVSTIASGDEVDLITLIAMAMLKNPEIRKIFEKAYSAVTAYATEELEKTINEDKKKFASGVYFT